MVSLHCKAGKARAGIMAACLMVRMGETAQEAVACYDAVSRRGSTGGRGKGATPSRSSTLHARYSISPTSEMYRVEGGRLDLDTRRGERKTVSCHVYCFLVYRVPQLHR